MKSSTNFLHLIEKKAVNMIQGNLKLVRYSNALIARLLLSMKKVSGTFGLGNNETDEWYGPIRSILIKGTYGKIEIVFLGI